MYCAAYDNLNYDPRSNGEHWLISRLSTLPIRCVFDVGANRGEWADVASRNFLAADIHVFEIAPGVGRVLQHKFRDAQNISVHLTGLSSQDGNLDIFESEGNDELSSVYDLSNIDVYKKAKWRQVASSTTTGDLFCSRNHIDEIDFLKIDVEGAEYLVLEGFANMIERGMIGLIQFEYGMAAAMLSRRLVTDFWNLLNNAGYKVGKLMPRSVDFSPYHSALEFKWANFIAVQQRRQDMLRLLSE